MQWHTTRWRCIFTSSALKSKVFGLEDSYSEFCLHASAHSLTYKNTRVCIVNNVCTLKIQDLNVIWSIRSKVPTLLLWLQVFPFIPTQTRVSSNFLSNSFGDSKKKRQGTQNGCCKSFGTSPSPHYPNSCFPERESQWNWKPGLRPRWEWKIFYIVETGPCLALFQKWYFDSVTQTCRLFTYGGGHLNTFKVLNSQNISQS